MEDLCLGKKRSPLGVCLLSLLTLNTYYVYWYYKINEEMASHSNLVEVNPVLAALAVSIGTLLIVPPYISARNSAERLRRLQEEEAFDGLSPSMALLVQIFFGFAFPYLIQSELNAHWDLHAQMASAAQEQDG